MLWILLLVLLFVLIAGGGIFFHFYSLLHNAGPTPMSETADEPLPTPAPLVQKERPTPEPTATPDPNDPLAAADVYHLLLLGGDDRTDSYAARTDAMMLLTIQKEKKKILLTSFLRDTYVYIPGWGYQRLNAANVVGGPEKLMETIDYHFGVRADHYIFVNFFSFAEAVDALGGVDIALDDLEVYYINAFTERYDLVRPDTGVCHLDGEQLLAFCRNRSIGSDTRRAAQQRRAIEALWARVKDTPLHKLSDTAELLLSRTVSDLDALTLLSLLGHLPSLGSYEIIEQQIPADGTFSYVSVDGASVLEVDFEANRALLRELIE